jgi:F-type H+-transporting ATPase subunit c
LIVGLDRRTTQVNGDIAMLGAGLAALGVVGPGIGIGILTGMSTSAMGRNPDAAAVIRATFILGAAFAEGLGILAFVVGVLIVFLK